MSKGQILLVLQCTTEYQIQNSTFISFSSALAFSLQNAPISLSEYLIDCIGCT